MKKPTKKEVDKIFSIADTDNSGTLEFDEFISVLQKIRSDNETEYREIFNVFDTDGNGQIDRSQLIQAFQRMGESLTPAEVDLLLEQYDTDHNGIIDFNELCQMMKSLY